MSFELKPDAREGSTGIIEFQGGEGKTKLLSSLSISNNGPHKLGYKMKTTEPSVLVKPGQGEALPGQTVEISLVLTCGMGPTSDTKQQYEGVGKVRLKLEVLYIQENWDVSQLSELLKSRTAGNGKSEYLYRLVVASGDRERPSAPQLEQSSIFKSAFEPLTSGGDRGLAAFQSTIDDPVYASALSNPNTSFGHYPSNQGRPEVKTSMGLGTPIERDSSGTYNRQLAESIEQKDKQIGRLEQEKRKLEQELSETRSKLLANRDRPATHAKASPTETWKLVGFALAALILGYFVGTK